MRLPWLVYPLQLTLILVFARIGEWILRAPPTSFSVPELIQKFRESPGNFFGEFGMTGVHGVVAWLFIAPILTAIIYFTLLPPLKRLAALRAAIANARPAK